MCSLKVDRIDSNSYHRLQEKEDDQGCSCLRIPEFLKNTWKFLTTVLSSQSSLKPKKIEIIPKWEVEYLPLGPPDFFTDNEVHPIQIELIKSNNTRKEKYQKLLAEDSNKKHRGFIVPELRYCNFGPQDDFETEKELASTPPGYDILTVQPIRFLNHSPFTKPTDNETLEVMKEQEWERSLETLEKQIYAIGVTETGKHVILQQAYASCLPTCVGMLLLDEGITPNYTAIQNTRYAYWGDTIDIIKEAGLDPIRTDLWPNSAWGAYPLKTKITTLQSLLQKNGPAILSMPATKHVIILDAIEDDKVRIRDPFMGLALTIPLESLEYMIVSELIQIQKKKD